MLHLRNTNIIKTDSMTDADLHKSTSVHLIGLMFSIDMKDRHNEVMNTGSCWGIGEPTLNSCWVSYNSQRPNTVGKGTIQFPPTMGKHQERLVPIDFGGNRSTRRTTEFKTWNKITSPTLSWPCVVSSDTSLKTWSIKNGFPHEIILCLELFSRLLMYEV